MKQDSSEDVPFAQKLLAAAVKAMYEHSLTAAKDQADAAPLDVDRIRRVLEVALSADDRSSAVVMFALYDDMMSSTLKFYLNPDIKGGISSLFDGFGMLSTANSRITLLASLKWISPISYESLLLIKKIRNILAHDPEVGQFSHPKIQGLVNSIEKLEEGWISLPDFDEIRRSGFTDRQRYLMRSACLAAHLGVDLITMRAAHENRTASRDIYGADVKKWPPRLRALFKATADALVRITGVDEPGQNPGT